MCGIVGYIGPRPAAGLLLEGLRRLEYRGYDSSGIAVVNGTGLKIHKAAGKLSMLEQELENGMPAGTVGIGHTRWATHGAPTTPNAHPHTDQSGRIAVIHNGIIENSAAIRKTLERRGHDFTSETDTEVLAHLVGEYYEGDLEEAVAAALREVDGAYGLAFISADEPGALVAGERRGLGGGPVDGAVDLLHQVERSAQRLRVRAQQQRHRHRHGGAGQGGEHPVLAGHVVSGGEHMPERRAAQHPLQVTIRDQVGEVGAAARQQLSGQRPARQIRAPVGQIIAQSRQIHPGQTRRHLAPLQLSKLGRLIACHCRPHRLTSR